MATILLTFGLILVALAGLAAGLFFGRPPLKGSCGGVAALGCAGCVGCARRQGCRP